MFVTRCSSFASTKALKSLGVNSARSLVAGVHQHILLVTLRQPSFLTWRLHLLVSLGKGLVSSRLITTINSERAQKKSNLVCWHELLLQAATEAGEGRRKCQALWRWPSFTSLKQEEGNSLTFVRMWCGPSLRESKEGSRILKAMATTKLTCKKL